MDKQTKRLIIGGIALVLLALFLGGLYVMTRPKTNTHDKTVIVQMAYDDVQKTVTIETNEAFLRGALEQERLIAGEESTYGLFVKTVDGRTVDDTKQEWWCITKNGSTVYTGVDTTPIADGDTFEITLKIY